MQLQSVSDVNIHIQASTHTHISSCLLEMGNGRHTHSYPPLISRAQTHIYLGACLLVALPGWLSLHTQIRDLGYDDRHTYTHTHVWWLAQTYIPVSHLQESFPYTLTALHGTCIIISQVLGVFLVRDSCIADCTVRYLGVERLFSS